MTTPTRLAPAVRDVRRPPALPRAPEPPRPVHHSRRSPASFERVLGWSIALSVLVHVLVLTLWPPFDRAAGLGGVRSSGDEPVHEPVAFGMQAIVPVPSDAAETADAAEAALPATTPTFRAVPPPDRSSDVPRALQIRPEGTRPGSDVSEEVGSGAAAASPRESLRPGFSDGRLYVDPRELRVERAPDRHGRYMEHLQARIDALNDSTQRGGPDTDWTRTDADGKRWGLSPEGLHLGGVTIPRELIPLPRSTGRNAELEEARERARQRAEIIRQEEDRARREALERTRKAADERRKKGGGGGTGGGLDRP